MFYGTHYNIHDNIFETLNNAHTLWLLGSFECFLTHISMGRMEFPTVINLTRPFSFKSVIGWYCTFLFKFQYNIL